MPEQEQKNSSATTTASPTTGMSPPEKQFDVALVDPANPSIEHWPRMRVSVAVATEADVPANAITPAQKTFALADIERNRAIAAYNELYGLHTVDAPMLRYDVVPAVAGSAAPLEPDRWAEHRHYERGAPYFRKRK